MWCFNNIRVIDDFLPGEPRDYAEQVLTGEFKSITIQDKTFHGIYYGHELQYAAKLISSRYSQLTPQLTFARRSPLGQIEPNYIHSDAAMGEWTGILYLNVEPTHGDGTSFWQFIPTGAREGREELEAQWPDQELWARHFFVGAKFNRLLLFKSSLFHSRSIENNYGEGRSARTIQVFFGVGDVNSLK